MADTLQDTAPAVQNKTALREEILKNIEKKVSGNPALKDLNGKFGEDVKKLINETTNFYSGLGVALTADQIGDQILKTKFPKYNQKNPQSNQSGEKTRLENNKRPTDSSTQNSPRKITPKSEDSQPDDSFEKESQQYEKAKKETSQNQNNIDPYREETEDDQNTEKNNEEGREKQAEETLNNNNPAQKNNVTKIPPVLPNQTTESGGEEQNQEAGSPQTSSTETNSAKNTAVPPKLNSSGGNRGGGKREGGGGGDDNNGDDKEPPKIGQKNNLGQNLKNIKNVLSQNKNPKKLSLAIWVMLGLGAVIIDFAQDALAPTLVALVVNMLIDIFVGLALFTFFWFHKMLNRKLIISLLLGFLVDFVSLGIMPAWSFDIAYAWFVTDGASVIAKVPGAGEKAEELVQKIASKKA